MGRTRLVVVVTAVVLLAGGILASNMGFRRVLSLKAAAGGVESLSGLNTLGLPYVPKPGLVTVEDLWDEVALAEYPNRAALVAMSSSEAFREIAVHRSAGLEGQLNIETVYQPQMPQQLG